MIVYYDYSEDFQREVERLKRLKKRQQRYLRGIPIGFLLVPLGIGLILFNVFIYPLMFANFLYGPALIVYGLRLMWRGFINSDLQIAVDLAEKHRWNVIPFEKEECSINIGRLKQKIINSQKEDQYAQNGSAEVDPFSYALDAEELHILQDPDDTYENETKFHRKCRLFWNHLIDIDFFAKAGYAVVILSLVAAICVGTGFFLWIDGGKFSDGIYHIQGDEYSGAYIEVEGNLFQFRNIDLNEIYQEEQMAFYHELLERRGISQLDEDSLEQASDLNSHFVYKPWIIDYDKQFIEVGEHYTYYYHFFEKGTFFGFVIWNDALHKKITVVSPDSEKQLIFERR